MHVFPSALGFNHSDISRRHVHVRLHFPEMGEGVADDHSLASRKSLPCHLLAPGVGVPDAIGVVLIRAIDLKEHVRFEMLVANHGQNAGHGCFAAAG